MTGANGTGGALAHRPALDDLTTRQESVLAALRKPMLLQDGARDEEQLAQWKYDVLRATVGRVRVALREILYDPDFSGLIEVYFYRGDAAADEFRRTLRETLIAAFAWPLEDVSRSTTETQPTLGIASAAITPAGASRDIDGAPTFR